MDKLLDSIFQPIKDTLQSIGIILPDWLLIIVLLIISYIATTNIKKIRSIISKYVNIKRSSKNLHPFYSPDDIKNAKKFFIQTRIRNKPPSNYDNFIISNSIDIDVPAVKWFKNNAFNSNNDNLFYLVLSDSGMGKTTFLINLYLDYSSSIFKKYDIKLFPIGHKRTFIEIEKIKASGKDKDTILLLDAFDEDSKALENWIERFHYITEMVQGFRKIVITSRTQFFPKEIEEPYQTKIKRRGLKKGFHEINKMYVSPFNENDINTYLNKKFGKINFFNEEKKNRALQIVKQSPTLMIRPMLLAYIDDLLQYETNYKYLFQIYEGLILMWISRESEIIEESRRDEFKDSLYQFSEVIAKRIYENWKNEKGLFVESNEIDEISNAYSINLKSLEMKSKSLLNRNVNEQYKFSHKSILEYFLAKQCITNETFSENFIFTGLDQAKKFVSELGKVKLVINFIEDNNIKIRTGYYDMPEDFENINGKKTSRFIKTITLNKLNFELLLIKLDSNIFTAGFNELLIQNIIILEDSSDYKTENLKKILSLKRITIYTNFNYITNGKTRNIEKILPNCYIPKWH